MVAFARVPNIEHSTILQFLDRGVMGIQGPHIADKAEAQALVDACLFPPEGNRGWGGMRGTNYGGVGYDSSRVHLQMNEQIIPICQLEDIEAFERLPEILEVERLEYFRIGPNDLALSMGLPPDPGNPKLVRAIEKAVRQIHAAGKKMDTDLMIRAEVKQLLRDGFRDFLAKARKG